MGIGNLHNYLQLLASYGLSAHVCDRVSGGLLIWADNTRCNMLGVCWHLVLVHCLVHEVGTLFAVLSTALSTWMRARLLAGCRDPFVGISTEGSVSKRLGITYHGQQPLWLH